MVRCVAWAATGVIVTLAIGVLTGMPIEQIAHGAQHGAGGMRFVRIGDAPASDDTPAAAAGGKQVVVDNFSFTPATSAVPVGTTAPWRTTTVIPRTWWSPETRSRRHVLDPLKRSRIR